MKPFMNEGHAKGRRAPVRPVSPPGYGVMVTLTIPWTVVVMNPGMALVTTVVPWLAFLSAAPPVATVVGE